MRTVETQIARKSRSAGNVPVDWQEGIGSCSSSAAETERAALAEWYAQGLRPKLSRAVRAGVVSGRDAAALERLMTDLLFLPRKPGR